jgi:thiamine-monophosphate kinase
VLSGGDDYELAFTAAPARRAEIEALSQRLKLPLARVGSIVPGAPALAVLDAQGRPVAAGRGFDHFA